MFKWTKKTMTWGGFTMLGIISTLIGMLVTGVVIAFPYIKDKIEDIMDKFKK